MNLQTKHHGAAGLALIALSLMGLGINAFLLYRWFTNFEGGIAGCGGGNCEGLSGSRWATIFGIPITALGAGVYLALLGSLLGLLRHGQVALLGLIAGAAAWFIFVQAVIIGSFCPWCMAAHGIGLSVVALGATRMASREGSGNSRKFLAGWTVATFLVTALSQIYGPVPATHKIEETGRIAVFEAGKQSYEVASLPRIGRADAKHILVEYFDYQCPACQAMAGFLETLVARHPASVAVLVLPVPLERSCNSYVTESNQHAGSCEISRIALAVWRENPAAFEGFHHSLMKDPSPANARAKAIQLISAGKLDARLKDQWIEDRVRSDITDWRSYSSSTEKMPKLLIRDGRMLHGLPSSEEDFIRVLEMELGL